MEQRDDRGQVGLETPKRRTGVIVFAALAVLALGGALHLIGILPPGG